MLIFVFALAAATFAQDKIRVWQEGKILVIEYDLEGDAEFVDLYVSLDWGVTYEGPMTKVNGDLRDVEKGLGRQIRWNPVAELGELKGDVKFKLVKKLKIPREFFALLNMATATNKQQSLGLTIGTVKRVGCFVSLMSNFSSKGLNYDMTCDPNGYVDGIMPFYSGNNSKVRLSAMAGLMIKFTNSTSFKIGGGYGLRYLCYQTSDGNWVKNVAYSYKNPELMIGLQQNIGLISLSLDLVRVNFNTKPSPDFSDINSYELKFGLGVNFKKR